MLIAEWVAPGPVSAAFMEARGTEIIGINGPVGSGKTRTTFTKALRIAARQSPSKIDGIRRCKILVVRRTYREMWRSTIPTWRKIVPEPLGEWSGGKDQPARHELVFNAGTQWELRVTVDFAAIGEMAAEDFFRGYEPTVVIIDEADLVSEEVIYWATTRTGRFPDLAHAVPVDDGVLLSLNAPELGNYLDAWMEKREVEGARLSLLPAGEVLFDGEMQIFVQPGGMTPSAENRLNLPADYYDKMVKTLPGWLLDRMVHNKRGLSRSGDPVYPEYNDHVHFAGRVVEASPGARLVVGVDAGFTPAAVIKETMADGQVRWLGEVIADRAGPQAFGLMVKQYLGERFPRCKYVGSADPAANAGGDLDDGSWIMKFEAAAGFRVHPAPVPGNAPNLRLQAVREPLERMIGGQPGFLLSSACPVVRRGFMSGYRLTSTMIAGGADDEKVLRAPAKNKYSHPHDAGQYANLFDADIGELLGRPAEHRFTKPIVAKTDFRVI